MTHFTSSIENQLMSTILPKTYLLTKKTLGISFILIMLRVWNNDIKYSKS